MAYTFDPLFAADPNNPAMVAKNAAVLIFDPAVPNVAVTITDATGSPLPNPITVNAAGFGPAFQHATLDRLGWSGGGFENYITSYEGMKQVATEAKTAAESAASSAGASAAADLAARIAAGEFKGTPGSDGANGSNVLPTDAAIAAAINGTGTATKAALTTQIGTAIGPRPAWATANRPFDPRLGAFNLRPDNLAKWRRAKARAAGGLGQAHITCGIDSNTYGAAATGVSLPKPENSWPGRLRRILDAQYGAAGTGIVVPWDTLGLTGIPADDPRWNFVGAITAPGNYGIFSLGDKKMASPGAGATYIEFTAPDVDEFWIYGAYGNGSRNTVQIDGGVETYFINGDTVSPDLADHKPEPGYGTPAFLAPYVVKVPVARGAHTIRINPPAAAGFNAYIFGVEARVSGQGVRISNLAHNGMSTSEAVMDSGAGNLGLSLSTDQPRADLSILMISGNDFNVHRTVAAFKTNAAIMIDRQRAQGATSYGGTYANGDVLLVCKPQPNYALIPTDGIQTPPLADYFKALYELAEEKDVPLLDLGARFVNYATSADMFADATHVNDLGAEDIAQAIHNALTAV